MVRVTLGSNEFDTFVPSNFTDSYVKLVFVAPDVDVAGLPQPLTQDSFAVLPPEKRPRYGPSPSAKSTPRPVRSRSTSSCTASTAWRAPGRPRPNPVSRSI